MRQLALRGQCPSSLFAAPFHLVASLYFSESKKILESSKLVCTLSMERFGNLEALGRDLGSDSGEATVKGLK